MNIPVSCDCPEDFADIEPVESVFDRGGRDEQVKVIYYMSVFAFIVNKLVMIGTHWVILFLLKVYLFWINLVLLLIFNRLKKRRKNDEQV